jgi:hypothetical protein
MEIDVDPATGMRNVVPWFPSGFRLRRATEGQGRFGGQPYFILGDPGGELDVEIESREEGYEFSMAGPLGHLRVSARGGRGVDRLTVQGIGTDAPALQLRNTAAVDDYHVRFTQIVVVGRRSRTFELSKLAVNRNAPVDLQIVDNQSAVSLTSSAHPLTYDLSLSRRSITGAATLTHEKLRIGAGEAATISPVDWRNLKRSPLRFHARELRDKPVD